MYVEWNKVKKREVYKEVKRLKSMKWIYNFLFEEYMTKKERFILNRNYSKNIEYRGAIAKVIQWRIIL